MNDNCIYFHLKQLQLGPIDAAFQELQYALKNSARANFSFFLLFLVYFCLFLLSILQQKFLNCVYKW